MFFKKEPKIPITKEYFVSAVVGSETGIAVTTAIVLGLNAVEDPERIILTAIFITSFVQAFNAGVSVYLGKTTEDEVSHTHGSRSDRPFINAFIQFTTYMISALIPITPLLFLQPPEAIWGSVIAGVIGLVLVGSIKGRFVKKSTFGHVITVLVSGVFIMLVGYVVGKIL